MNPIERAEKEFAAYFNMPYGVMMCNGTATLHCCLLAAGVGPGDEVIVPALTMASPALAVRYCGAKVVYADIRGDDFHIDWCEVDTIKRLRAIKAVMSVSIYGYSQPYAGVWDSTLRIQDNAQCLSPDYGHLYAAHSFSFQATKHITTGEGGMVLTQHESLARKLRQFSNLGYDWPIEKDWITRPNAVRHNVIGYNYRPSVAQAKLLLDEIPHIPERIERRRSCARLYRDAIGDNELLIPQADSDNHSYWTFAAYLRHGQWNDFVHLFRASGGDRVYGAWRLPYQEPALYDDTQHCPVAEKLQPKMLQFKTNYTDMKQAEQQAQALKKTLDEYRP